MTDTDKPFSKILLDRAASTTRLSTVTEKVRVEKFIADVRAEFYKHRAHMIDGRIEADFLEAIRKTLIKYECPDCMYSIEKGHQT